MSPPDRPAVQSTSVLRRALAPAGVALLVSLLVAVAAQGVGASNVGGGSVRPHRSPTQVVTAVGAENEYADVIAQIGGSAVDVSSILNNPNTDPHTFESSPAVARSVGAAQLIVQNGVGYDSFMNRIESATPSSTREVITVQNLLGLPDSTPNPHLWYDPETMPRVALAIASDLASLDPGRASYFVANLQAFDTSLQPWLSAIVNFGARYSGAAVATTEPVADYLLSALGANNKTPFGFQADIMNGIDPSPQDITAEDNLLTDHEVKVFVYNEQVVDALTISIRSTAERAGIPVVGVYETMPTPGYDYQSWMLAEVKAIENALSHRVSTEKL